MGDSRSINPAVAVAIIAVVIAIVGFFLWRGTGGSTAQPRPGQTLENPFGTQAPGPSPGTGR
jgi:hypothetical protein